ncbi:hypothetical protein CPB86DRAFT_782101 [Serendipita vermifera]|nr:hypothetical protein CPB86DRAFT_782101 [Serendipita vermifera]
MPEKEGGAVNDAPAPEPEPCLTPSGYVKPEDFDPMQIGQDPVLAEYEKCQWF